MVLFLEKMFFEAYICPKKVRQKSDFLYSSFMELNFEINKQI